MERNSKTIFLAVLLFLLVPTVIFATPNQITLQGKLTTAAGAAVASSTKNFTFRIYDSFTGGTELWRMDENITTDANGVYDVILKNLNLSFADQYYLGIQVYTDNESTPRINLTSAPYSIRANASEDLNQNNSYIIRNLSVTANTTLGSGALSTLQINTLYLNLTTSDLNFSGGLGISGASSYFTGKLGIGIIIPASKLDVVGDVSIAGPLNASSINVTGNAYFATASGRVGIGATSPNVTLHVSGNTNITGYLEVVNGLNVSNGILLKSGSLGIGDNSPYNALTVAGSVGVSGSLNASSINTTGNAYFATSSGSVGIGTISPSYLLQVASGTDGRSVNLSNVLYVNGSSGKVGINTTFPAEAFDVNGNIKLSSTTSFINISGPIIRKSGNDIVISD